MIDSFEHAVSQLFPGTDPLQFIASALVAGIIIVFSANKTFNEPTTTPNAALFETTLPTSIIGSKERLGLAKLSYILGLELILALMSIAGPQAVNSLTSGGNEFKGQMIAWPIFLALVLTGVIPKVAWLQKVELSVRTRAHDWALIPEAVREIAKQICRVELKILPTDLTRLERFGIVPKHLAEPPSSINHLWARIQYTIMKVNDLAELWSDGAVFEKEFIYLSSRAHQFERKVDRLRRHGTSDDIVVRQEDARKDLSDLLKRISIFLACASMANCRSDSEAMTQLRAAGYAMPEVSPGPSFINRHFCAILVLLAFVFLVTALGNFLLLKANRYDAILGALDWAVGALLLHGSAALAASSYRRERLDLDKWKGQPSDILMASFWGIIASALSITAYVLLFHPEFVPHLIRGVLPWALLGGVTAGFVAFYLSIPQIQRSKPRCLLDAILQGGGTALAVWILLIATDAQFSTSTASSSELFKCVVGFGIGCIIGWFVPSEYRRAIPYDGDRYARMRYLDMRSRATKLFQENQAHVNEWLYSRLPDLGCSPFEAAATQAASARVFNILKALEAASGEQERLAA
jgi:hypothetical protein